MILVDGVTQYETRLRYKKWSHMVSTESVDELHRFASRLGLRREWFQEGSFAHYDITPPKRALAIKLGAFEVSARELLFLNFDYQIKRPGKEIPIEYLNSLEAMRARILR